MIDLSDADSQTKVEEMPLVRLYEHLLSGSNDRLRNPYDGINEDEIGQLRDRFDEYRHDGQFAGLYLKLPWLDPEIPQPSQRPAGPRLGPVGRMARWPGPVAGSPRAAVSDRSVVLRAAVGLAVFAQILVRLDRGRASTRRVLNMVFDMLQEFINLVGRVPGGLDVGGGFAGHGGLQSGAGDGKPSFSSAAARVSR